MIKFFESKFINSNILIVNIINYCKKYFSINMIDVYLYDEK